MRRGAKPAKGKVEAKLPRKSPKNDGARVRDLEKRLAEALKREAEALEQQTATSEILRVISSSPTGLQPVLDAVAENATRVCSASDAVIRLLDRGALQIAAHYGPIPVGQSLPVTRGSLAGRAVMDRQVIHVEDMSEAPEDEFPEGRTSARRLGIGTALATPLLREGVPIGAIVIRRNEVRLFSDKQIELLKTFADQAVIAIENVRLFTDLETRNRDLTDALEQQTATSEILRVISSSPTDLQPIFDAIARNAVALCGGIGAVVLRFEGEMLHVAGHHNVSPEGVERAKRAYPRRPARDYPPGRAFLDRSVIHVPDLQAAPEFAASTARQGGAGSQLAVPLLREHEAIGVIAVSHRDVAAFSAGRVELLKTFADQAVIAIENVRLFKELEARNRDLTEALEQQTATSEILRVIASSPTDLQPVLDAVVERAARLCGAEDAIIYSVDGDVRRQVAHFGSIPRPLSAAVRLSQGTATGRAILERRTIHIPDVFAELARGEYPETRQRERGLTSRTLLITPLLREDVALGAITIRRTEMRPFSESQIALLRTFADQAVIAIENVRLFKELEEKNRALTESLEQQTATAEILRVISSSPTDVQPVFDSLLDSAIRLCGATHASLYRVEGDLIRHVAARGSVRGPLSLGVTGPIPRGTAPGQAVLTGQIVQVTDAQDDVEGMPANAREFVIREGVRTVLAVPLLREGVSIGVIVIRRTEVRLFAESETRLLKTFADQAVIAIENVRLFRELQTRNQEIAEKSRQIEVASQHKSEFLANMSHELRTPLNAIIGFSEVLTERMFGDLNEKQEEYLKDIYGSGTHLLSLINDILDLSKIEAGRMELELTDFDLPQAIDNALTLVRERAGRRGIALEHSVDERLGEIRGDERKIKQVLLNLLSNALKFTPEGGRVEVRAGLVDGLAEISVTDTGVGIAPEDQGAIFEEFRQVGTAEKKAEGTGLGLTLCRKFIELHGGKIWVTSQVGAGSTFTFRLAVRCGE